MITIMNKLICLRLLTSFLLLFVVYIFVFFLSLGYTQREANSQVKMTMRWRVVVFAGSGWKKTMIQKMLMWVCECVYIYVYESSLYNGVTNKWRAYAYCQNHWKSSFVLTKYLGRLINIDFTSCKYSYNKIIRRKMLRSATFFSSFFFFFCN